MVEIWHPLQAEIINSFCLLLIYDFFVENFMTLQGRGGAGIQTQFLFLTAATSQTANNDLSSR